MNTAEFLTHIRDQGIKLHLKEGRLICNAPKDVMNASIQQNLKVRKQNIINFLAHAESITTQISTPPILPANREMDIPLTSGQERLWYLSQFDPTSPVYNMSFAFNLKGKLNKNALDNSINEIINRHEILHTTFKLKDGKPIQSIMSSANLNLQVINIQDISEEDRETELGLLIKQKADQPFNLTEEPLIHLSLFQITENEHILLFIFHHMIFDAWSFDIFAKELSDLYNAYGKSSPLSNLQFQYADYAVWQKEWMESENMTNQLKYWENQLNGQVQVLDLPSDLPVPVRKTNRGTFQSITISESIVEKINNICKDQNTTLFIILLTVFKTLLNRYSNQNDINICTPVACREQKGSETLIGYFNNIVILRTDLSDDPDFLQLISRVQKTVLEAQENQLIPFQVIADLPHLSNKPLTRALFQTSEPRDLSLQFSGLEIEDIPVAEETVDFDLSFDAKEVNKKLECTLWYKTDLFSDKAIMDMLENFQDLLEKITSNPITKISNLPSLKIALSNKIKVVHSISKDSDNQYTAPRDNLEVQIQKIWEEIFDRKPISIQDNFFELGGHSMMAVRIFAQLQEKFTGRKLPLALLFKAPTIEQLAAVLRDEGWSDCWSSLVPIQSNGSRIPFFFIHAHGGNVLEYHDLSKQLGPDQPFYGLQARNMDKKIFKPEKIEEMASHYIKEIKSVQSQGPYLIGGWCLGGSVAYEMAQQLNNQGDEVALLVLVETAHPDFPEFLPNISAVQKMIYLILHRLDLEMSNFLEVKSWAKITFTIARVKRLWFQLLVLIENMMEKTIGKTGYKLPHSQAYYIDKLSQSHIKAYEDYLPKSYNGHTVHFVAAKQPRGIYKDYSLGWKNIASDHLIISKVKGHRIGIISEPRVKFLAAKLREYIDQAMKNVKQDAA